MATKMLRDPEARDNVSKKKNPAVPPSEGHEGAGRPSIGKQVNVRIPNGMLADLELIAADGSLDISAVVRMILSHHVKTYVRQIQERRQQQRGE